MIQKLSVVLVCSLFWMYPVNATHLGPIVFGQERVENVPYCSTEKDAMFIANQEEESIMAHESVEQYLHRVNHLFTEGNCKHQEIRYTPKETIYQWEGRISRGWNVEEELVLVSIVKSEAGGRIIYTLVADEAPPPISK